MARGSITPGNPSSIRQANFTRLPSQNISITGGGTVAKPVKPTVPTSKSVHYKQATARIVPAPGIGTI